MTKLDDDLRVATDQKMFPRYQQPECWEKARTNPVDVPMATKIICFTMRYDVLWYET